MLRKCIDCTRHKSEEDIDDASWYMLWSDIKRCKLANQILENHKIVNFKEANKEYQLLSTAEDKNSTYKALMEQPYNLLKQKTDELLRKSKVTKFLQTQKNG